MTVILKVHRLFFYNALDVYAHAAKYLDLFIKGYLYGYILLTFRLQDIHYMANIYCQLWR